MDSGTLTGSGTDTSSGTLTDSGSTTRSGTDTSSGAIDSGTGTITDSGTTVFVYNLSVASEVTTSSGSSDIIPERVIAEFSYDVLGRRISKQTLSSAILYIYSGEQIIQEIETTNGVEKTKEYVYGNGGVDDIIATIQEGNTYYYHKDQIGSVVGITDSTGNLVSEYTYDTFGKAHLVSGSEIGNSRLFTGREYDNEIGLYYYRARYYSAELGRFISRDPIDTSDDVNLYGYVKNNPVNRVDPSGLKAKQAIVGYIANSILLLAAITSGSLGEYGDRFEAAPSLLIIFTIGNGGDRRFENGHPVANGIKNSNFYINSLNELKKGENLKKIMNGGTATSILTQGGDISGGETNKAKELDVGLSVGKTTASITGHLNKDGYIETFLTINDTYDFHENNGSLNELGVLSQKSGDGKPFNYTINITDKILLNK